VTAELDRRLTETLMLTFPASDPIALSLDGVCPRQMSPSRQRQVCAARSGLGSAKKESNHVGA
jgi:hypothetical protein